MESDPVTQKQFADHTADDVRQFNALHEAIAALPTKADMDRLATKDDISELVAVYKNFQLAGRIISGGGKWTWRTIMVVAGVITMLGIITGGLKGFLALLFSWAMPK